MCTTEYDFYLPLINHFQSPCPQLKIGRQPWTDLSDSEL